MGNYYDEINRMMNQWIHKILMVDKKGFKIGIKGENLSLVEIYMIKKIGQVDNKKIYELVEEMEMDRSFIASATKNLILNGYIKKEKSKQDKRVYILSITPSGREILEKTLNVEKHCLQLILEDMSLNEEKAILKFLQKMNEGVLVAVGKKAT